MNDGFILRSGLDCLISNELYGMSITFPCGWVKIETLKEIIRKYENGEIDRYGSKTESNSQQR